MSATSPDPEGLLVPLASARGDLAVVRQLIKGQYGKRLLQLRMAADRAVASAEGQVTPWRACYALLARVQREQPEVFRSLLMEPDIAVWLGSREGHPGALGYIAAAAAILTRRRDRRSGSADAGPAGQVRGRGRSRRPATSGPGRRQ
jgi:HEXXH motif-containing protein